MENKESTIICENCNKDSGIIDGIFMDVAGNSDGDGNIVCNNCGEIVFVGEKEIMRNINQRVQDEFRRGND